MNDEERRARTIAYRHAKGRVDAVGVETACQEVAKEYESTGRRIGESYRDKDDRCAEENALLRAIHRGMSLNEYLRAESALVWLDMDEALSELSGQPDNKGGAT